MVKSFGPDPRGPRPGADARPWMDLRAASVKVRRGMLCVTLRTSAALPDESSYLFTLVMLGIDATERTQLPARLTFGVEAVTWFSPGAVEAPYSDTLRHDLRRTGSTIRVAVRTDAVFPRGIGGSLSFATFRWRIESNGRPPRSGAPSYLQVDCAPGDVWSSYPSGRRSRIAASLDGGTVRNRCEPADAE